MRRIPSCLISFTITLLGAGCLSTRVPLNELRESGALEITLDANTATIKPGHRPVKFYVDIRNRSKASVDLTELDIELTASPEGQPSVVSLRKEWGYRQASTIVVRPGKQVTFPILPESNTFRMPTRMSQELGVDPSGDDSMVTVSEFPLTKLAPGHYEIRAIVGKHWTSSPYRMAVQQPRWGDQTRVAPKGLLRELHR